MLFDRLLGKKNRRRLARQHSSSQRKMLTHEALETRLALAGVTVFPDTPGVANCYPFGSANVGSSWLPYTGFIYQNIPAFTANAGDKIAFDLGVPNDFPPQLQIEMAATTANGGTVPTAFTKLVSNTQLAADPDGDSIVGNFELAYTVENAFVFNGGGLIIRFSQAAGAFSTSDFSCSQVMVYGNATDTSGYFLGRFYEDGDGLDPYTFFDTHYIGAFKVTSNGSTAAFLDASGNLVISDQAGSTNDDLQLSSSGGNVIVFNPQHTFNASVGSLSADGHTLTVPVASITGSSILLNTLGGDDRVSIDSSISASGKNVAYDAGTGGNDDALTVTGGGGATTATYTPSTSTPGNGSIVINGSTMLSFVGLEPVDITGFGTATVASPANAANALVASSGFDSATGTIPAIVVAGNTGLGATMIESAHLYNNTTVVLDTSATTGSNSITVNGFASGHNNANLQLKANALGQVSFNTGATNISGALDVQGAVANVNQVINASAITGAVPLVNVTLPGQIQDGIDMAAANGTVNVAAGTYNEDLTATKNGLHLLGAGAATTTVIGPIGGSGSTLSIAASNVEVAKLTLTRAGNNTTDWNNAGLNSAGISAQGAVTGLLAHDNIITGMRTAIDINNSSGHTIRNNVITQNRTGLIFRNQTDNITFVENAVTDNFTVGILFLDASGGTNSPVQSAVNSTFSNNNISGNWYGQIVDRQNGGALPAPGTTNLKNFSNNWFGTSTPVISTADSTEPGYAAQIPVIFGGSATAPGGQPDVLGPAVANFDITPYLHTGVDTNVETTPGRGTFGFQGDFSSLHATAQLAQTGATARIQEAVNAVTAGGTVYMATGAYTGNVDTTAVGKNVTLAPGSSPGQVTINGNLVLDSNDTVAIEINGTNAATNYDNFIVNGTVSLGNATLTVTGTYTPTATDGFILISNDSTDAVTGIFNGLPPTTLVNVNGTNMRILYTGSSGNDVVLAPQFVNVAYVEDTAWNALNVGDVIPDADFGTASSDPAIYGYNAFNSIASAIAALTSSGMVIVNDGTYAESPTLNATKSLRLTKFNSVTNGTVTLNSIDGIAGTTIDLGTNTLRTGDNVTNNSIASLITGAGNLVKLGSDVLTLSNAANSYSGSLTVSGGTLSASAGHNDTAATSAFGNPLVARTITVASGATLQFANNDILGNAAASPIVTIVANGGTIANNGNWFNSLGPLQLNGATLSAIGGANTSYRSWRLFGSVTVGGSAASTISATGANAGIHLHSSTTFDVADATGNANADLTISGPIFDQTATQGFASGALIKNGVGTLVLSAVNSYTGTTTVTGGTLLVNGNLADGAAANDVIVNNTAVLGGSGNIGGAAIVNAGGKITGGTLGAVGTLTLVGGLSFNGGQYAADINGDTGDRLVAGGVVDLANTTAGSFAINSQTGTPSDNNVFLLISKTSAGAITDPPFNGLAEGSSTTIGGKTAVYSYAGNDGNDFTLTVAGNPTFTFGGNLEVRRVTSGLIDNVQLLQNGVVVDSRPLASITSTYTVNGNSAADFLLINYTNVAPASGFIPRNITFNGGAGGSDKLQILGSTFDNITHTFLNANDGTILLDPTGPGANQTVQYTGLEPVLMNVGSVTNVIFNLPGTADNAILEDDTELVANTSQIRSINSTFERTTFTHPTGSLTVNAGAGDNLTVATTEAFATANTNFLTPDTISITSLSAGGNADWEATNSISQTGAFFVGGNIKLITSGVNAPVTLFNASNQIGGEITLTATGDAQIRDTLGAMVFYLTNVGGNLTVQSDGGDILQTGIFFTINGTSSFRTTQNNADIVLHLLSPNNDFIGAVSLFTVGPTGNASIGDRNALNIGLSTVGGTLFAHAENGNLTSSNTVTAGGTVTFDASAAILDGNAGDNIVAPAAELRAATGIGSSNPLETKISQLAALNTTSNNIQIANTSGTLLTLTTLNTTVGVKNNGAGTVEIFNDAGGITVAADSNAGSLFQLTTTDTAATENITVNPNVTVQSDGIIDFNAGDNFSIPLNATLSAVGVVTLDSLDNAVDAVGSTFDFFGNVDAANISFNGNAQNDVFNIQLDNIAPLTHMNVDGKAPSFPTPLPGDTLNLFALGTPTLIVNGIGSGQWTGLGQATLDYIDIETVTSNVPYHLAIDMGAPGLLAQNSVDARLDDAASANFEVRVDTDLDARDGTLAFQGPVGNVVSFAVLGSNDGEAFSVTQNAQNLLPGQTGGFNGSSPFGQALNGSYLAAGRTPTVPNAPPIHFTGNGNAVGSDIFRFNLNLAEDVGYFADGAGSGDVNVQGKLAVSFNGNEFVDINQLAIGGSIVVDSSSYAALANMTITDTTAPVLGAVTQVDGDAGFADARFKNFANVTIRSGLGQDTIDLVSINPVGLTSVVLDSDSVQNSDVNSPDTATTADDIVRLRSLPATASALLKGSPGRDTYQLYDANLTVDNILGPVTVGGLTAQDNPGEVGNNLASQVAQDQDTLIIIDSGSTNLAGAIVNVTETTVDGLTGYGGIDVTYSNIDYLDVTATSGPDHIYVNMANGLSDLNTATVRGSEGKDLFDIIPGVENFVPTAALPANQLQKFTDLFLFGDGPDVNTAGDIFGYDDFIRPSKTVIINIDGGVPSVVAPPGNFPAVPVDQLPYQLSNDAPSYDRLNLNMARGGAPQTDVLATSTIPVVVDTVGDPLTGTGTATSASHTMIKFRDIEYFNVWDKDGPTNVQRGDLYVRSTENNDSLILYPDIRYTSGAPNGFTFQALKIRYNNKDIGPYYQTNNSVTSPGKWIVYARQGNDNISVNNWLTRDTEIFGGSGNDYIAGSNTGGKDLLVGGWGNDRLQGLAGDDVIYGDRFPEQLEVVGQNPYRPGRPELGTDPGVAGVDTLNGGYGNDVLDGGGGNDKAYGEDGDDIVYGGDGNDTLGGDRGFDIVIGGNGNDRLNGGMQRDILIGGMGVDNVDGDQEQDIVVGDASNWDTHTFDTDVALLALMFGPTVPTPGSDYWSNLGSTYTQRTIDGSYLQGKIAPNLLDDNSIDTIVGDLDLDWYFDVVVKNDKYSGRVAATEKLN